MSYIGQTLPADTFQGFTTDSFTGDASATTFTLSKAPFSENGLIVVINNVIQKPTTNFTVSGTTLTIVGTAVASGDVIYATHLSGVIPSTLASKLDTNGVSDALILDADADTTISADTDDQIDFKAGGTDIMSLTATTATFNDGVTITTADNTDQLTLVSTDADASTGPILKLLRDSGSPADNDLCAVIKLNGDNDANEDTQCYEIRAAWNDVSNGTEDGAVRHALMVGGTLRDVMTLDSGLVVFNEEAQDIDFKIESASQTTMFNLQAVNGNNSAGSIGFNSSNSDGNFFEAVNPQTGVYSGKFSASAASGNIYGINLNFAGQAPDNNTAAFLIANDSSNIRFRVYADGDVQNHDNSYGSTSDERIKQQIADASSQWDDMKAVKVRKFKFNSDVTEKGDSDVLWRLGVVAQELEASGMNGLVKPEVLYTSDDQEVKDYLYTQKDKDQGLIPDGKDVGDVQIAKKANVGDIKDYKSVKYSVLYMKAIKALQEAMAKIETLETKVKALEDA
jgi:hypothetical protein